MIRHGSRPWFVLLALTATLAPGVAGAQTWMSVPTSGGGPVSPGGAYPFVGFDEANRRAIAYGGIPHLPDVWVLQRADGVTGTPSWTLLAPNGGPPPSRHGHGASYDAGSNRLIVFGGCSGGCLPVLNDVWVLTNANGLGGTPEWIQLQPPGPAPAGRAHPAVAYDAASNRLIVFGGQNGSGNGGATFSDVWVLSNANGLGGPPAWQQLAPAGGPPPGQYGAAATYDTALNRLTVFGGGAQGTGLPTNAVWDLENANGLGGTPTWINAIPEGAGGAPPPIAFARPAHDREHHRTIYVGTNTDLWVLLRSGGLFQNAGWVRVQGATPPPTPIGLIGYTPASGRLTVFEPSPDFVGVLHIPAKPVITLEVNGAHPSPPVVATTGQMRLTLSVSASTYVRPVGWYWLMIVNGQPVWVTSAGLSTEPAPLVVAPPQPVTDALLFEVTLPAGTTMTHVFLMIDDSSIVSYDVITARVSGSS